MIAYASQTSTKRNLAEMRRCGWRLLISAAGHWQTHGFSYALDNGRWADFTAGNLPFDADRIARFERLLDLLGDNADFVVVPDIVMGGAASLRLTMEWLPKLAKRLPETVKLLIAVQNGMEDSHIARHLSERVGIAVGGDTDWKEASLPRWAALAHKHHAYLHVLRVNTQRRIKLCRIAGADSIDGSSATRFAVTTEPLDGCRRQFDIEGFIGRGAMRPAEFADQCREIVATATGHAAHRALDALSNRVLESLGFGAGVAVFETAVRGWHHDSQPYPAPQ